MKSPGESGLASSSSVPFARARAIGFTLALVATFASWLLLMRRFSLPEHIRYWFWFPTIAPRPAWWLIALVLTIGCGVVFVIKSVPLRRSSSLLTLMLAGVALQHLFALMEGRGLDGIRDRMLYTGHARFAMEAIEQPDMWRVARQYQALIEHGKLPRYPNATKPPGQLLFYMATERLSHLCRWCGDNALRRLATFASLLWPLLAYLPIVPLYLLGRLCFEGQTAYIPCLVYLCVPSVTLVTLHLDECLYPLLFVGASALCVYGARTGNALLLASAGLVTSLAMFVSFSLVVLLPFLVVVLALEVHARRSLPAPALARERQIPLAAFTHGLLSYLFGVVVLQAAFIVFVNYNAARNYLFAMGQHQAWKIEDWPLSIILYVGGLDFFELALWSGLTLSWLFTAYLAIACLRPTLERDLCGRLALACAPVLLSMIFLGKTVGETARLWLFMTPLLTLFASKELITLFAKRLWSGVALLVLVQLVTVFAFKLWMDFH